MGDMYVDGELVTGATVDGDEVTEITIDGCSITFEKTETTSWFSGSTSINLTGIKEFISARVRFRGTSPVTTGQTKNSSTSTWSSSKVGQWIGGTISIPSIPSAAFGCAHSSANWIGGCVGVPNGIGTAEVYAYGYGPYAGTIPISSQCGPDLVPGLSSLGFEGRLTSGTSMQMSAYTRVNYTRTCYSALQNGDNHLQVSGVATYGFSDTILSSGQISGWANIALGIQNNSISILNVKGSGSIQAQIEYTYRP